MICPDESMPSRAAQQGYSTLDSVCTIHSEFGSETQGRMQTSEQSEIPKIQRGRAVSRITLIMRIVERQENTEVVALSLEPTSWVPVPALPLPCCIKPLHCLLICQVDVMMVLF